MNAFYRVCTGAATCNCGVSVRSGQDVFIVDQCRADKDNRGDHTVVRNYRTQNPRRVGLIGCDKKAMKIRRNGNMYMVCHLKVYVLGEGN